MIEREVIARPAFESLAAERLHRRDDDLRERARAVLAFLDVGQRPIASHLRRACARARRGDEDQHPTGTLHFHAARARRT
jgi:hypothetical protein